MLQLIQQNAQGHRPHGARPVCEKIQASRTINMNALSALVLTRYSAVVDQATRTATRSLLQSYIAHSALATS